MSDPVEIIASAHDKAFRDKHQGIDPIIRAAHRGMAKLSVAALEAAGYVLLPPGGELCGAVYAGDLRGVTHTCGRPYGHPGAHYCRCIGIENYTWPAEPSDG